MSKIKKVECPFCSGSKHGPFVRKFQSRECTECDKNGIITEEKLIKYDLIPMTKARKILKNNGYMRIPNVTVNDRFYVATSLKNAYSSWGTLIEAQASIKRFKECGDKNFKNIICIVRVNSKGKEIFKTI